MKPYLIALILILLFTCWLNDSGSPPSPQPIIIEGVPESTVGAGRQESMIPDFLYQDKAHGPAYVTRIDENSQGHDVEFPMGAP